MTPYEAQILIACCIYRDALPELPPITELREKTLDWMINEELINSDYSGTDRAKAWLEAVLNTPLPVKKWVIPI